MKAYYKLALALIAGITIGGAAIQGLHAQAKPPAYIVIPILKINDAAAFKADVIDKAAATMGGLKTDGGEYVIRNTKFTSLDGTPPERLILIKFDSIEKAQAFWNSPAQQEVNAGRMKTTNSLAFIVEGIAN
jgi:uncharacterized protein (DUF1330 family)